MKLLTIIIYNIRKIYGCVLNYKEEYEKAGKMVEKTKKDYEIMKQEIETQKEKNQTNNLKYKKCREENDLKIKEAKEKQKNYMRIISLKQIKKEKNILNRLKKYMIWHNNWIKNIQN